VKGQVGNSSPASGRSSGGAHAKILGYEPQVLQSVAPQLAQKLPPTGALMPLSLVEKQAKVDNIRSAVC
jgi:hypothetical protein